ncbi:MAG: ChbG/HpnK family deacetylase [Acidobacteriaceae bacterium]
MKRLIINADDYGLTRGVNRAVAELHAAAALTSATLMAGSQHFSEAAQHSVATPSLGVGCHVVLVDGAPISPLGEVSSLIADSSQAQDSLRKTPGHFLRDLYLGRIRGADIEREACVQIRKLQQAGVQVTHIDTHKHMHSFPAILRPVLRAARACGVTAVRNPYEPDWSLQATTGAGFIRRLEVKAVRTQRSTFLREVKQAGLQTTDGAIAVLATGSMTVEGLQSLLHAMPGGTWELVCHPGYNDAELQQIRTRLTNSRETELHALKEVVPNATGLHRIHYGEL